MYLRLLRAGSSQLAGKRARGDVKHMRAGPRRASGAQLVAITGRRQGAIRERKRTVSTVSEVLA